LVAVSQRIFKGILPDAIRLALAKVSRLIVSPDGPLWELPFSALVMSEREPVRWLGLEKSLTYTPSLNVFALEQEREREEPLSEPLSLVVGDPMLERSPGGDLDAKNEDPPEAETLAAAGVRGERSLLVLGGELPLALPAARMEAERVAGIYNTHPLLGAEATEEAVRSRISDASVVHFATHGYFHPKLAMSSGVLLAVPEEEQGIGETNNDGALQAWEFGRNLRLRADLVVLSACETGRGQRVRGEGIIGLTRALQLAGARSIVATQWRIADEASAELMIAFHENLQGGLAKDEALRRAMLKIASEPETSAPYFWAAYFLVGVPGRSMGG
jgi:CHAT domain-containing protein